MSYYRIGSPVPVNINMVTAGGIGVTNLDITTISLILLQSGITQSISGHYTVAPQQNGIYRIVFDTTVITVPDVDYVLIAHDTTGQAIDDKVEFTVYTNSIDTVNTNLTNLSNINSNKLDIITNYVNTLQPLLTNTTYGLSALQVLLANLSAQLSNSTTTIQSQIATQLAVTNGKIDSVASSQTSNQNTLVSSLTGIVNQLNAVTSYTNNLSPLLTNGTYGLNALEILLVNLSAQLTVSTATLDGDIASSRSALSSQITTVNSNVSGVGTQVAGIPLNPLLTTDSRLLKLNTLDTTASSLPALVAGSVWSYGARYLTGASGVNQIDLAGISTSFIVGQPVNVNTILQDSTNVPVTGRSYPTSLGITLLKGGVVVDTTSTGGVSATETRPGIYRISVDGKYINTPSIDYLLAVTDTSNKGVPQYVEFTAFNVAGVAGPRVVTINVKDGFTLLPIPDTQVYIKDPTNSIIINKGITGVSGSFMTGLTDGTYNVILRKSFVDFGIPQSLIVSGDTTAAYQGLSFSPSSPTSPVTCVVYGWVSGLDAKPIKNAKVQATETQPARYSGAFKLAKLTKNILTDANGYWELELIRSSQLIPPGISYSVAFTYPGFSWEKDIIVPDTSSVSFITL